MKRRTFTLIELLVVIAIIAILAAMLLPVLNKARDMGREAQCLSNNKNLGTSWLMYSQDNNAYFPDNTNWNNTWQQKIYKYVNNQQIFVCPKDILARPPDRNPISYGIPGTQDWGWNSEASGKRINTFRNPSRCVVLVELHDSARSFEGGNWQYPIKVDPFPLYTDGTSYPHNDKTSSWLVDGHVRTLRLEEIRNYRYNYVLATEK